MAGDTMSETVKKGKREDGGEEVPLFTSGIGCHYRH
jgi:hypothetical protein